MMSCTTNFVVAAAAAAVVVVSGLPVGRFNQSTSESTTAASAPIAMHGVPWTSAGPISTSSRQPRPESSSSQPIQTEPSEGYEVATNEGDVYAAPRDAEEIDEADQSGTNEQYGEPEYIFDENVQTPVDYVIREGSYATENTNNLTEDSSDGSSSSGMRVLAPIRFVNERILERCKHKHCTKKKSLN